MGAGEPRIKMYIYALSKILSYIYRQGKDLHLQDRGEFAMKCICTMANEIAYSTNDN